MNFSGKILNQRLSLRIYSELLTKLRIEAKSIDRSLNWHVINILVKHVNQSKSLEKVSTEDES